MVNDFGFDCGFDNQFVVLIVHVNMKQFRSGRRIHAQMEKLTIQSGSKIWPSWMNGKRFHRTVANQFAKLVAYRV